MFSKIEQCILCIHFICQGLVVPQAPYHMDEEATLALLLGTQLHTNVTQITR